MCPHGRAEVVCARSPWCVVDDEVTVSDVGIGWKSSRVNRGRRNEGFGLG